MEKTFFAWYKSQDHSFQVRCALKHNNAPHISKLIHEFFEHERLIGEKIVEWQLSCPNLNLIKTLRPIVKMKLHEGGKQYNC